MKSFISFALLAFLFPLIAMTQEEEEPVRQSYQFPPMSIYASFASNYFSSSTLSGYKDMNWQNSKQSPSIISHGLRDLDIEVMAAPSVGETGWQFRFGLSVTHTQAVPAYSVHPSLPEFYINDSGVRLGVGYKLWRFYGDFSLVGLIVGGAHSSNQDFEIDQSFMYELDAGFELHKNICLELFYKESHLEAKSLRPFDSWTVNAQRQVVGSRLRIRF